MTTSDTIVRLPTAASEPPRNPAIRGRYPQGVASLRSAREQRKHRATPVRSDAAQASADVRPQARCDMAFELSVMRADFAVLAQVAARAELRVQALIERRPAGPSDTLHDRNEF